MFNGKTEEVEDICISAVENISAAMLSKCHVACLSLSTCNSAALCVTAVKNKTCVWQAVVHLLQLTAVIYVSATIVALYVSVCKSNNCKSVAGAITCGEQQQCSSDGQPDWSHTNLLLQKTGRQLS